eukprot:3825417-Rhodomonas_salina.3
MPRAEIPHLSPATMLPEARRHGRVLNLRCVQGFGSRRACLELPYQVSAAVYGGSVALNGGCCLRRQLPQAVRLFMAAVRLCTAVGVRLRRRCVR